MVVQRPSGNHAFQVIVAMFDNLVHQSRDDPRQGQHRLNRCAFPQHSLPDIWNHTADYDNMIKIFSENADKFQKHRLGSPYC